MVLFSMLENRFQSTWQGKLFAKKHAIKIERAERYHKGKRADPSYNIAVAEKEAWKNKGQEYSNHVASFINLILSVDFIQRMRHVVTLSCRSC